MSYSGIFPPRVTRSCSRCTRTCTCTCSRKAQRECDQDQGFTADTRCPSVDCRVSVDTSINVARTHQTSRQCWTCQRIQTTSMRVRLHMANRSCLRSPRNLPDLAYQVRVEARRKSNGYDGHQRDRGCCSGAHDSSGECMCDLK